MFTSILIFILVLSILVLVHELGHFIAAKKAGLFVEEFGFGIPPRVFGKKIGETIYSINLLPFGGFVRIHGQNEDEKVKYPQRAFFNKGKLTRSIILVAGVFMNFLLGIIAFAIVYSFSGIPQDADYVSIVGVEDNSPASAAGMKEGDKIIEIEGMKIATTKDFISEMESKKGEKVSVKLDRDGESVDLVVTPRMDYPENQGPLGVVITQTEIYFPPIWQRPFLGAYYGTKEAVFWGKTVIVSLFDIFGKLFGGEIPKDVAGPVGIFAVTSEAAKIGALTLINFVGILSINLAIFNLIPFPALDGGILLFVFLEGIVGKKVLPKVEAVIHNVGMIILIGLLVLMTIYDVRRLVVAGSIENFLKSLGG